MSPVNGASRLLVERVAVLDATVTAANNKYSLNFDACADWSDRLDAIWTLTVRDANFDSSFCNSIL